MAGSAERRRPAPVSAFGHLLKRRRLGWDLTQEELAERAGVSARLISDLERGTIQRPRRETVRLLADALGLVGDERDAFVALARGWSAAAPGPVLVLPAPPPRGGLPRPPNPLIGRQREVAEAAALLIQPEVPLLTLTGPGGVGKTRLALEVALATEAAFADGACFVDLAPVRDPALVPATIARALGVRATGEDSLQETLVAALRERRLLLLLDNCEHLLAAAPAVADLLAACPALTVLATSRRALRLRAEHDLPVPPLTLPDLTRVPAVAELAAVPAVALFVQRAAAVAGSFALTDGNAEAVAGIAVRLDGLPLALELAAARVRVLPPTALLDRLEPRLPVLTGGPRDLPERQQALRATIGWSHGLLAPEHRRLFRRLAVFAGGFGLGAAEAVAGGEAAGSLGLLEGLAALVEANLLRSLAGVGGEPRFSWLETIREYGLGELASAGEADGTRRRHLAYFLALAEQAEPELMGTQQARWFARLESEHDNLRAALGWALEWGEAASALRLAAAIQRYWMTRAELGEGRRWLERGLVAAADVPAAVRAKALAVVARIAYFQGDYGPAAAHGEAALAAQRALGDEQGTAVALRALALVAEARGDDDRARALYEEALARFQTVGDRTLACAVVNDLGMLAWRGGDVARAELLQSQALALAREIGDRVGSAAALCALALVAIDQNDYERAAAQAAAFLELQVELGNQRGLVDALDVFAVIAAERREDERAARLFAAGEALRRRIGARPVPKDRAYTASRLATVRERLGEAAFGAAWEAGWALPPAAAWAEAEAGGPAPAGPGAASPAP